MSRPEQAVFRLPASAMFIPILVFFVATPVATGAPPWTLLVYLLPLYALAYVFWTRTVADDQAIRANMPLGRRKILWADLDGFEFQGSRWAVAVTLDGKRTRLPMVRPRDLRRLAAVSGGRLYLGEDAADLAEAAASEGSISSVIGTGPDVSAVSGDNSVDQDADQNTGAPTWSPDLDQWAAPEPPADAERPENEQPTAGAQQSTAQAKQPE